MHYSIKYYNVYPIREWDEARAGLEVVERNQSAIFLEDLGATLFALRSQRLNWVSKSGGEVQQDVEAPNDVEEHQEAQESAESMVFKVHMSDEGRLERQVQKLNEERGVSNHVPTWALT